MMMMIYFNSVGVYERADSTAQVPITKPAQEHKYNSRRYKYRGTKGTQKIPTLKN